MSMVWSHDKTVVTRLRVRSAGLDSLTTQQRLTHVLNNLCLHPSGLSPSVILCIRSLRAPKLDSFGWEHSHGSLSPDWESAVRAGIERLARAAARPIDGPVHPNAEAVIFADRAELLACMATDWCAGEVNTHWWWKSLFHYTDLDRVVIQTWLESPQDIPAAVHVLESRRQSVSFVRKLSDESTRQLIRILIQSYGLPALEPLYEPQEQTYSLSLEKNKAETARVSSYQFSPWHENIRDRSIEQLPIDRQILLGVALLLYVNPSVVRDFTFVQQVRNWQIGATSSQSNKPFSDRAQISIQRFENISESAVRSEASGTEMNTASMPDTQVPIDTFIDVSPHADPSTIIKEDYSSPTYRNEVYSDDHTANASRDTPIIEIISQFGGICYFINLGLYLNLYGDFTTPMQPGIDLPIWDFVALMAQEILGDQIAEDPIWSVLAKLSGRAEADAPGLYFRPSGYGSVHEWLQELMRTVRPRLQAALGVGQQDLASFFKQSARVLVTPTRFDVYFSLSALPIEIRLSGMDRDPGWVPAAGKFIGFHYE